MEKDTYELKELDKNTKKENSNSNSDGGFVLIESDGYSNDEGGKPTKYYSFVDRKATGEDTDVSKPTCVHKFFSWMRNFEMKNREGAGLKYTLFAITLLTLIGGSKIIFFPHVTFIDFLFLQTVGGLLMTYIICRILDVTTFLTDKAKQIDLKISAFLFLIGGILYLYSWDHWPRQYAHFLLALVPFGFMLKEMIWDHHRVHKSEILFFVLNLAGMYILLAIPNTIEDFSYLGLGLSGIGVVFIFSGYVKMGSGQGNLISMTFVYLFVLDIFLPAFFAVQKGVSPSIMEVIFIVLMSPISLLAVFLGIRSTQIAKDRHILLFGSLGLATVNFGRGIKSDGMTAEGLLGTILSFFGATLILINEHRRTQQADFSKSIPLIS